MQRASDAEPAISAAGLHALGQAYASRREYAKAVDVLRRAATLDPTRPESLFHMAEALTYLSKWDESIDALRRGLAIRFSVSQAGRLGKLYRDVGNADAAMATALDALQQAPHKSEPYEVLCDVLAMGRTIGDIEARVASLFPEAEPTPMRIGLARALEQTGRYEEARECWMVALRDAPDDQRVVIGTAEVEVVLGNIDAAAQLFDRVYARHPDDNGVVLACTEFLIRCGRFRDLWDRIRAPHALSDAPPKPRPPRRALPERAAFEVRDPQVAPRWNGKQPLYGKTILLDCRGGYGDVIQFARFGALFKERGASVVLEVPPCLVELLRTMKAADEVVAPYEPCRPLDYQCRAAYSAFFVEWSPHWMQASTPYLSVEPARRHVWSDRFDPRRLNVGIVWRTTAENRRNPYMFRSVPLREFQALADVPGVTLYGLQVGAGTEEVTADTRSWLAANFESETRDFRDAAAAIDALDVVVSPDSGLAHLTGALGKPCFVLLPRHPSWRWMTAAPELAASGGSVWYPDMRLFRQQAPGDWSAPMQQIADSLRTLALARTEPAA